MMSFLWWPISGLVGLVLVMISFHEPIKRITLSDIFGGIFFVVVCAMFGPITILIGSLMLWDERNWGKIVIWKKKKKTEKNLTKEANKLGFTLTRKPIKLKGIDDV